MSIQEIVKYATSTPHNTNPNVLKSMLEQEMTSENFNKVLAPIVEAIESVGGTVESETVEGVVEAVENLDDLINPIETLPSEGTDLIGEYHQVAINTYCTDIASHYIRVKRKNWEGSGIKLRLLSGAGVDLTELECWYVTIDAHGTSQSENIITSVANRVILPEVFPYVYKWGSKYSADIAGTAPGAIYLSKRADCVVSSRWITSDTRAPENIVKCPKDTEIPYHLNKFTAITVESMVGIFENLIDNSNGDTTLTLTLGTDNLAKLTEEQKNIAYAKGWNLA